MPKDLFSDQSQVYAKYRPTYPVELFEYIISFVEKRECAWDCATGNGQAASELSNYFTRVDASDISESQLSQAIQKPNIHYHLCAAEETSYANDSFDLITIATAYHWLNPGRFKTEATRVARQNAVIAAWGYSFIQSDEIALNELVHHFYYDIVYSYWDRGRRHMENSYKTVEFEYEPLPEKEFRIDVHWTKEQFTGFFQSWSAVQTFTKENNASPLPLIKDDLEQAWGKEESRHFHFPIFLRLGRVVK